MASRKFYLNTAIDYSNGAPHLGHALEKIGADCVARYHRLIGEDVHFVIGMDEHGQKVSQTARQADLDPQTWVDRIARDFQTAWSALSISYDDFIRTTEPRHRESVQALLRRIHERHPEHLFEGTYSGYYCVGCEAFKLDKDLVDGQCPNHPSLDVKWVEEQNHFFRLSAYRDRLLRHYDRHPTFVQPPAKMNEVRNLVDSGLHDLSISRSRLPWGIPFPDAEDHSVYVWFDALINYLSATGFPHVGFDRLWPSDMNIVGPDIIRFHAVIWPAMLMAAELPVPHLVWAHGWLNIQGARFSKTAGVQLTLTDAIERHGADSLRYYILRDVPWDGHGDFTLERFDAIYNAELANTIGNLLSRTVAMVEKYAEGRVPAAPEASLDRNHQEHLARYRERMDRHLLHEGAQVWWEMGVAANQFIEAQAPWKLAKEGPREELDTTLAALHRALVRIAVLGEPFLPHKARELLRAIGIGDDRDSVTWPSLSLPDTAGIMVARAPSLFPRSQPVA